MSTMIKLVAIDPCGVASLLHDREPYLTGLRKDSQ
jgi:hypothetical protein